LISLFRPRLLDVARTQSELIQTLDFHAAIFAISLRLTNWSRYDSVTKAI
jgi:hypothetical protein